MISKVWEKLKDPEYRKAFVSSQINIGIPFQIRALLRARGETQEWLADRAGMLQPRISGLMTPGKTRPNIETLRRIAQAFDCGLVVHFAPFSELVRWSEDFDPEEFSAPSFEHDSEPCETFYATSETCVGQFVVGSSIDWGTAPAKLLQTAEMGAMGVVSTNTIPRKDVHLAAAIMRQRPAVPQPETKWITADTNSLPALAAGC